MPFAVKELQKSVLIQSCVRTHEDLSDALRQLLDGRFDHRQIAHPRRHIAVAELVVDHQPLFAPVPYDRLVCPAVFVGR